MTSLKTNDKGLNIIISNEKNINFDNAKYLIRKAKRIIQQNKARAVIIEIDHKSRVDKSALEFFNRVLCYSNSFPVVIIGA